MSRSVRPNATTEADALRSLAAHLRSGSSLRTALHRWPEGLSGEVGAEVLTLERRVRLRCPIVQAVEGLGLARVVRVPFELHLSEGVGLADWLERTADEIQATTTASASARAAAAGAVLSGRIVAGLPLLFVVMAPLSKAPLTDGVGVFLLVLGVILAVIGLRWIGRLVPRPPSDDPVAAYATATAALLDAGAALPRALEAACRATPSLDRAPRLVRLGLAWTDALVAADDRLRPVTSALVRASALGTPAAPALRSLATARRAEELIEFDHALRRAPVLMVVPLVCCVLPSYGLLGLAPFLRSISLG